MPRMIFVNLPVTDLSASTAFYEAIGMTRDPNFSNAVASAMTWSDTITFMLLTHDFYRTFTAKAVADTRTTSAALLCLSQEGRDAVDTITEAALAAGGREPRPVQDQGCMYGRCFEDPDGHAFEAMWMDAEAMLAAMAPSQDA